AEVIVAGGDTVDLAAALGRLAERGLRRVDCEGGPRLFAALLAAGVVDELRLTISPFLLAGTADRITAGGAIDPATLRLDTVVAEDDTLLLRYLLPR
ncbi:MAG: dihydrofolate reductase family protein, partial [Sciscionella sp.]